jgi:hypothetical protein
MRMTYFHLAFPLCLHGRLRLRDPHVLLPYHQIHHDPPEHLREDR